VVAFILFAEFICCLPEKLFVFVDYYLAEGFLPGSLDENYSTCELLQRESLCLHQRFDCLLGMGLSSKSGDVVLHCSQKSHVHAAQIFLKGARMGLCAVPLACDGPASAELRRHETHVQQFGDHFVVLAVGNLCPAADGLDGLLWVYEEEGIDVALPA
jgi:hypothetical protein